MLTPDDIRNRKFLVSLRGYDKDEVEAFLSEVAEAYRGLQSEARGGGAPAPAEPAPTAKPEVVAEPVQAPAPAEPAAVSPFAAIGLETQKILEAAHAAGEEIRRRAEEDAQNVRSDALQAAEGEVVHLQELTVELREQIATLEEKREQVAEGLRQARETVDLALLEIDAVEVGALPEDPEDPRGSVLANNDDGEDAESEPDEEDDEDE